MNSAVSLSELLNYSNTLNLETKGWHGALFDGYVGIGLVGIGILCILLSVYSVKTGVEDVEATIGSGVMGVFIIIFGSFGMYWLSGDILTGESKDLYALEERKWEREMVTPFLNESPVTTIGDIQDISYNYEMEIEEDRKWGTDKRTNDAIPVTVVTDAGKTYDVWANVEPLAENMSESTLEMKTLEKDLVFHERSNVFKEKGDFDVTLYTDKEF